MVNKKGQLLFMSLLFFLILTGCNGENESLVQTDINDVLDVMDKETDYTFTGSTSVIMSQMEIEDIVRFDGFINNKNNLYLDLIIASIEGMPEEKMEFAKLEDRMLVKYSNEETWNEVSEEESGIYQEINNWNPEHILKTIRENTVSTEAIEGNNGMNGILVKIDSEKVKDQIAKQLYMQLEDGGLTEEDIFQLKENMGLTDEEIMDYEKELEKQLEETKLQIDEIIKTMTIESNYEIYFDSESMLISDILHNTTTNYQLMGEEIEELTIVRMSFSDYGKETKMPSL